MRGVCFAVSVLLLCLHSCNSLPKDQPRAVTENGVVVGKYSTSQYGNKVYKSFQGIPYAKPPVGENRFKEPERLEDEWIGEWNATTPGSPCLQYDEFTRHRDRNGNLVYHTLGDEDCLFVNVYTQEGGSANRDVIVIVHHGSFMSGSANLYGPEYLMEKEDIVLVTFDYRVGPLGFLTTGDSVVPGNNGLKDQVAALKWVQRNIAAFGGDPKKVTLIGVSAGAASVHYHLLSPLSHGLFTKAYSYSGSALCPWALVPDGPKRTKRLASYLGCPTSDSKTMVKCLRRRPAAKIVEQVQNFHVWMYNPFVPFGPVVETGSNRPFIDRHPREILTSGKINDVPWIAGIVNDEGLFPASEIIENDLRLQEINERWHEIAPTILFYPDQLQTNIPEKMKEHYLQNKDFSRETAMQIVKMFGDRLFIAPIIETAKLQAQSGSSPVFMYNFHYQKGGRSFSQTLTMSNSTYGACHGDDSAYVIKFFGLDTHINEKHKEVSDFMINILLTYTKTGSPPSSLGWEPLPKNPTDKATYLDIITPHQFGMKSDGEFGNSRLISEIFGQDSLYIYRDEL